MTVKVARKTASRSIFRSTERFGPLSQTYVKLRVRMLSLYSLFELQPCRLELRHFLSSVTSSFPRSHSYHHLKGRNRALEAQAHPTMNLSTDPFSVTPKRGFLPALDPLQRLSSTRFSAWEDTLASLPKLLVAYTGHNLRKNLETLPKFDSEELIVEGDRRELWRAMLVLSFIAHAYVWADSSRPAERLPELIAVPWSAIAKSLGIHPVLVYATYNLMNWRRLDPELPIELGNIVCLHNFYGGLDEEWFRLVHVDIEAKAATAIQAILEAQRAASENDTMKVQVHLTTMTSTLRLMQHTLSRMGEKCDPYVYYHRIRRFMSGWRDNQQLPNGLVYEGVASEPQLFYGETGAQSSIIPAFDAALGVMHPSGWLSDYLQVMRQHMPDPHRLLLLKIEEGCNLRNFVQSNSTHLAEGYDDCVCELYKFRNLHKSYAHAYIQQHSPQADERGTGGTDFMPYLTRHASTTREHLINRINHQ